MASVATRMPNKVGTFLSILKKITPRTYYTYSPEPAQPIKGKQPEWINPEHAETAFKCLKSGNIF